jgi:hypothetical protein
MAMITEVSVNRITYFDRFYEIKGFDLSDKVAYYRLEDEFFAKFGENRYSSYESFRNGKYRYLRELQLKRR